LGVVVPHALPPWLVPLQLLVALGLWWIAGRPAVLRRLVPRSVRTRAVDARAKQVFLDRGVTETRDRSGVLVFVSRLEHRVEILADKGIHERVGVEGWKRHVDSIVSAIASDRTVDGLLEAIEAIGTELAEHFPRRPDDINELADTVGVVD
jgi:putative membrane protein